VGVHRINGGSWSLDECGIHVIEYAGRSLRRSTQTGVVLVFNFLCCRLIGARIRHYALYVLPHQLLIMKIYFNQLPSHQSVTLRSRRIVLKAMAVALAVTVTASIPAHAEEPIKVVYHVGDGIDQASRALANIRNQLRATPDTRIVVVGLGDGIKFLLKDATERNGKLFEPAIVALTQQGVEFRICMNTLAAHDVPLSQVIAAARPVPSGVVEITRLQAREGFVYLRP
jgi:intracellular sulfur oxidation DsrE/DsrF family protein